MTDRELLELAAKAAGYDVVFVHDNKIPMRRDVQNRKGMKVWNPLEDDGDALRLAVSLGLVVDTDYNIGAAAGSAFLDMACSYEADNPRRFGADRNAATRRAIVRAASEIGKGLSQPITNDVPEDNPS